MIIVDNDLKLECHGMGLFETHDTWSHPVTKVKTYELIYCLAGEIKIYEGDKKYTLTTESMLLLEPNVIHGGFEESEGHTSFYWLHFTTNDISRFNIPKLCTSMPDGKRTLRQILHYSQINSPLTEVSLAKFLMEIADNNAPKSKIAHEIREHIRIHSDKPITVSSVAKRFGYSPDHISKIYKEQFGESLKSAITRMRLYKIDALLINTNNTVKEISDTLGFENENDFVKFYKYNKHLTPTQFRGKFYNVYKNNR